MGYNTRHRISIQGNSDANLIILLKAKLESISGYSLENAYKTDLILESGSIKWYSFEEDIKKVSQEFPEHTIFVEGEGEENADIWRYYAKNGKGAKLYSIITFPEFTEDLLE